MIAALLMTALSATAFAQGDYAAPGAQTSASAVGQDRSYQIRETGWSVVIPGAFIDSSSPQAWESSSNDMKLKTQASGWELTIADESHMTSVHGVECFSGKKMSGYSDDKPLVPGGTSAACETELDFYYTVQIPDSRYVGASVRVGVRLVFKDPKDKQAALKMFNWIVGSMRGPNDLRPSVGEAGSNSSSTKTAAGSSMMVVQEKVEKSAAAAKGAVPEKPKAPAKPKKIIPRFFAKVESDAADWEPYSVHRSTTIGAPDMILVFKGRGTRSAISGVARLYKTRKGEELVVSLFPAIFKASRMHLELRYRTEEGFLQDVQLAAIRPLVPGDFGDADYRGLRQKGVEFEELAPSEAAIDVKSIETTLHKDARNVGRIRDADFGDELGTISLNYGVSGVTAPYGEQAAAERPAGKDDFTLGIHVSDGEKKGWFSLPIPAGQEGRALVDGMLLSGTVEPTEDAGVKRAYYRAELVVEENSKTPSLVAEGIVELVPGVETAAVDCGRWAVKLLLKPKTELPKPRRAPRNLRASAEVSGRIAPVKCEQLVREGSQSLVIDSMSRAGLKTGFIWSVLPVRTPKGKVRFTYRFEFAPDEKSPRIAFPKPGSGRPVEKGVIPAGKTLIKKLSGYRLEFVIAPDAP
jgi:hypothetical protein